MADVLTTINQHDAAGLGIDISYWNILVENKTLSGANEKHCKLNLGDAFAAYTELTEPQKVTKFFEDNTNYKVSGQNAYLEDYNHASSDWNAYFAQLLEDFTDKTQGSWSVAYSSTMMAYVITCSNADGFTVVIKSLNLVRHYSHTTNTWDKQAYLSDILNKVDNSTEAEIDTAWANA